MAANITAQDEDVERAISHLRPRVDQLGALDAISDNEIEAAIRERGLKPLVEGVSGDWTVEVEEHLAPTQARFAIAHDQHRRVALLRALGIALTWLTREEEERLFDDLCRRIVGMGAVEFRTRWQQGDLGDIPDSTVAHLLMSRPLGG